MALSADFRVLVVINFQAARLMADLMKTKPHTFLLAFFCFYIINIIYYTPRFSQKMAVGLVR